MLSQLDEVSADTIEGAVHSGPVHEDDPYGRSITHYATEGMPEIEPRADPAFAARRGGERPQAHDGREGMQTYQDLAPRIFDEEQPARTNLINLAAQQTCSHAADLYRVP
jgi:hypothetical protein